MLDRFCWLCAAVCLAAVSVFVAAVSVLVLAVSNFVLYQICVLCQFFWLLYRCVLLAAVSDCLATASGFCHFSVGFDQRPIGACLGGWVGSLEMSHERSWLETRFKAKALERGTPWLQMWLRLHAGVSAVTGSLPAKLKTTKLQSGPVAR